MAWFSIQDPLIGSLKPIHFSSSPFSQIPKSGHGKQSSDFPIS